MRTTGERWLGRVLLLRIPWWSGTNRAGVSDGKLAGDDADLSGIAELGEELLAVLPRQSKGADVGDSEEGHCIADGREMSWIKLAIYHC